MEEIQKYQSNAIVAYSDMEKMADAIAKSQLFGLKTKEQVLAIMLVCQAEGLHPAIAARDYDVIQGKPALKAKAKLARFQRAGGVFKWITRTDTECSAEFSHPSCPKPIVIAWDMKRAAAAGLSGKSNWKAYPRQMLSARVISEGVDAVYPDAGGLMYVPEEVQDFDNFDDKPKIQFDTSVSQIPERNYTAEFETCTSLDELKTLYESLSPKKRKELTALKNHCKKQLQENAKKAPGTSEKPQESIISRQDIPKDTQQNESRFKGDLLLEKISSLDPKFQDQQCDEIEKLLDEMPLNDSIPFSTAYFNRLKKLKIHRDYEHVPF